MSAIGIIIGREFRERVMKKSFIISTILTPLLMVGIMVGTSFIMASNVGEAKRIAVVDRSGVIAPSLTSTEVIAYEPTDRTPEELRSEGGEQMYGFLVIGENVVETPSDVALYSYSTSTMEVESAIARDIEEIIEQHRLAAYDIENLPQIMAEVEADVTLRSYKLGEEDEEDKESSSVLAFGLVRNVGGTHCKERYGGSKETLVAVWRRCGDGCRCDGVERMDADYQDYLDLVNGTLCGGRVVYTAGNCVLFC